jgi:hypothetical protein
MKQKSKKQFAAITKWQNETFPDATALSKVDHLKEEIEELIIDISFDGLGKTMEFADCFLLLYGAAAKCGMTYEDISKSIDEKMSINRKRKWGKPAANGVVKHIEETTHH